MVKTCFQKNESQVEVACTKRILKIGLIGKALLAIGLLGLLILFNTTPVFGSNLNFETISKGSNCRYRSEAYLVIKEESEWANLWSKVMSEISPPLEVPKIDFLSNMVIAVFMGEYPTGGYSIEIREIVEEPDRIVVMVEKKYPPPGSGVTQALSQPYHIVKIERTDKEIVFEAGVFRVNLSVLTSGWAYPDEEIKVQVITFLDKYEPPGPGQLPPPLSPGDWVYMGNVPLRFDVKDEAGNSVNINIPQDLRTDDLGFLEITFKAPGKEGKYAMTVNALIKGVECFDSKEFTVSSEKRVLPTPAPGPVPTPAPADSALFVMLAILIPILAAAILSVYLFIQREKASS